MRTSDLQLLAIAFGVATVVALLALRRGRRLGAVAIVVALALAVRLDRSYLHAVPEDSLQHLGPWFVGVGALLVVAWSARRLPAGGLPVPLLLAGGSLVGVWAGVPETSAALLGAGVLGGACLIALVRRATLTRMATVVVALVPVGAALVGATGNEHALLGGLLCSATVVLLGVRPPSSPIASGAVIAGTAVHLASALVAARHVGVARAWDDAIVWIPVVVVLAAVAATILRRGGEQA